MLDFKIEGDTVVIEAPKKLKAKQMRDVASWMSRHGIAAHTFWRPEIRYESQPTDPRAFLLAYECDHYGFDSIHEEGWDGRYGHRWLASNLRDCLMIAHFDVVLWSNHPSQHEDGYHATHRAEIVHDHHDQNDVLVCCSSDDDTMAFVGLILWANEADKIRDQRRVITVDGLSKHGIAKQLHECFMKARGTR